MNSVGFIILQVCTIVILLMIIIFLIRQNIALRYESRIGKCSVIPVNDNNYSLIELLGNKYLKIVKKLRKYTGKLFKRQSRRYEKYITYKENIEAIDIITNKLIICLIFAILSIFDSAIKNEPLSIISLSISIIFGYYILDIYLIFNNKRRKKKIENEMLRAIIIMNNAFKAGKSTIQALEIASNELPSPIKEEFNHMYRDMNYGLSIEVVFERFAERVNIEEAKYLSSSLTILNRTGGNIINVFDSIERTLFNKQKLQEELKNSTASSKVVVLVLIIVPIVFVNIIYTISPDYFNPLFNTTLGHIILSFIAIMFIAFVYLLRKILKIGV